MVLTREVGTNYQTGTKGKLVSDIVIQNVRVLGMDLNADPNSTKAAVAHTATMEVTPKDSERLALAAQAGQLSLALRRTGAVELQPVHAVSQGDLGPSGLPGPIAIPVRRVHRARPLATAPAGVGVLVVHGEASSRMEVPSERFNG